MATINAPSMADTVYSGECPLANAHGYISIANAQIGDVIRLNKLYQGTKIYSSKMINAALGSGVTLQLGWSYTDGSASGVIIPAASMASAGKTDSVVAPFTLALDAYITATVGGGAATGQLDVINTYEFKDI